MAYSSFFWITFVFSYIPGQASAPQRYEYEEPHMGTLFRLQFYAPDKTKADHAAQAVFARARQLNSIFSDYQNDSELMKLSQKAGSGPVKVSPELADILHQSKVWSEKSDGAFDVTIGPVIQLWRKARRLRELPKEAPLQEALSRVGYRHIKIDLARQEVSLAKPGMRLDLGGIAKGYTVDELIKTLKKEGITSACVAAGGDVCVSARPPGSEGWVISVAPLEGNRDSPARLLLEHQAVSTAGDLEQYVEIQGVRYSHIVNPKTGIGLVGRMSCTVVASCGVASDVADTTVCVMGPEKGLALIEKHPHLACLILTREGTDVKRLESRSWSQLRFQK